MIKNKIKTMEIIKTSSSRCDFPIWELEKLGREKVGKIRFCPDCLENKKSEVPIGERMMDYKHLWETLKCWGWSIKGNRTVVTKWTCDVCGYRREEQDTYKRSPKRHKLDLIKNIINISIESNKKSIEEYERDFPMFLDEDGNSLFTAKCEGKIEAYKETLKLLKGDK